LQNINRDLIAESRALRVFNRKVRSAFGQRNMTLVKRSTGAAQLARREASLQRAWQSIVLGMIIYIPSCILASIIVRGMNDETSRTTNEHSTYLVQAWPLVVVFILAVYCHLTKRRTLICPRCEAIGPACTSTTCACGTRMVELTDVEWTNKAADTEG
jgi:hypothetical protein